MAYIILCITRNNQNIFVRLDRGYAFGDDDDDDEKRNMQYLQVTYNSRDALTVFQRTVPKHKYQV